MDAFMDVELVLASSTSKPFGLGYKDVDFQYIID